MSNAQDTRISAETFAGWLGTQDKCSLYKETDKGSKTCPASQQPVALSKMTNISWPGLPICGAQIPITWTDKRLFSVVSNESCSTAPRTTMPCRWLTLTGKAGVCKARPGSGKTSQSSGDSPPSLGLAVVPWKEPWPGKKPGSCVQPCQCRAMRPRWGSFVSLDCCFSFVK